jgi:CRP-like cAMP-binding protein
MNRNDLGELKEMRLFSSFPDAVLKDFVRSFRRIPLKHGDVLFREGEEGSTFYIIVSGDIAIEKRMDKEGKKFRKLAVLKKGDYFGEMAVLEGQPRFAQARAIAPAEVVELERTRMLKFIDDHPREGAALLIEIILVMLKRLRHTSDDLMAAHGFMEVLAKYNQKR